MAASLATKAPPPPPPPPEYDDMKRAIEESLKEANTVEVYNNFDSCLFNFDITEGAKGEIADELWAVGAGGTRRAR